MLFVLATGLSMILVGLYLEWWPLAVLGILGLGGLFFWDRRQGSGSGGGFGGWGGVDGSDGCLDGCFSLLSAMAMVIMFIATIVVGW